MTNQQSNRPSLLLVEDEAIVRIAMRMLFGRLGYSVVANTATGEEAVELARRLRPDVVVMDIHLAGSIDGIEAGRQIREFTPQRILFVSAYRKSSEIEELFDESGWRYLEKPVREDQITRALEELWAAGEGGGT